MNSDKIIKRVSQYKIISFDIYDTLVKRNVPYPRMLFDFVEKEYNRRHNDSLISGFRIARINAEKAVKEANPSREILLDEIYQLLDEAYINKEELKSIEIEQEIKFSEPNIALKKVFDHLIKDGKRVILISDMYLPQDAIEKVLKKCGIEGYEKLYLSSQCGYRKKDGSLFDYVIKDLCESPKNIIHLGDRKKPDNIIPRLKGFHTIYIDRFAVNTSFITRNELKTTECILYPYINNQLPKYENESKEFRWGYESFGPLILGFCYWIHQMVLDFRLESLFFLSRDMYLVEKVYRSLFGNEQCKITYLEASRKSMRIAYVRKKGSLNAVFDTIGRDTYTASEVLDAFDIKYDFLRETHPNIEELFLPDTIVNVKGSGVTECFLDFENIVYPYICETEDHCMEYLNQMGLYDDCPKAMVDIGWHGTIQNMLEELCDEKITGLYFGICKRPTFKQMDLYGYLFNFTDENDYRPYESMVYLLETTLFPAIGSTQRYMADNERIVPVFGEYEVKDFSVLKRFQDGAVAFARNFDGFIHEQAFDRETCLFSFLKLCFSPQKEHAKAFADLNYEDLRIKRLASSKSFSFYLFHPLNLVKDYDDAKWKEGFLKLAIPGIRRPHEFYVNARRLKNRVKSFKRQGMITSRRKIIDEIDKSKSKANN